LPNATQTNVALIVGELNHNNNDRIKSKANQNNTINGGEFFKQLLSQKITDVSSSDKHVFKSSEKLNDSPKFVTKKHDDNKNTSYNANSDTPNDSTITLKPTNVEFSNSSGKAAASDNSEQYSIAMMKSEAIKLQEKIQNEELILNIVNSEVNTVQFNEMMLQSPLLYHVNFAVDNSVAAEQLSPEAYAQPVEMLSCEVSSHPFIATPSIPLSLSNDWQIDYLQNPSSKKNNNELGYKISGASTEFMVNIDGSNFNDTGLTKSIEDTLILERVEAITKLNTDENFDPMTLSTSQDLKMNGEMIQICSSYNTTLDSSIELRGYDSFAKAVGKQISNAISSVSVNMLKQGGIEVSLYPETLGCVKITYNMNEKAEIHIAAEKASTLMLLQQNANEIKETLMHHMNDGKASVDLHFEQNSSNNMMKKPTNTNNSGNDQHMLQENENTEVIIYFSHNGIVNFVV
jgi:hypothetical protein